ncbi:protein SMG9-like [Planoprotostelium fungivorum]|uniref:Protein SMG9-like n=1 Tax=Planoprotostelium fungivorum TaxID=1890364 RepID=A0A2P6NMG5_9EUKA|nr:protein SMG9-like [Planoprotostelium fungivorum]
MQNSQVLSLREIQQEQLNENVYKTNTQPVSQPTGDVNVNHAAAANRGDARKDKPPRSHKDRKPKVETNLSQKMPQPLSTPIILGPKPVNAKAPENNFPSSPSKSLTSPLSGTSIGRPKFEGFGGRSVGNTQKLMQPGGRIVRENCNRIFAESPDALIVGVLGREGVGKSTILSLLSDHICTHCGAAPVRPFMEHQMNHISQLQNQDIMWRTRGMDCIMTPDKKLLIDVEPLWSASQWSGEDKKKHNEDMDASQRNTTFLFTLCDLVLVVQENVEDVQLLRSIREQSQALEVDLQCLLDTKELPFYTRPQFGFIYNKIGDYSKREAVVAARNIVEDYFPGTPHGRILCLPHVNPDHSSETPHSVEPFNTHLQQMRKMLNAMHKAKLSQNHRSDWLRNLNSLWEVLTVYED